jgi:hypothetical protein
VGLALFAAPSTPQVKTAHVVKQQEQKKTVAHPAPKPKVKSRTKAKPKAKRAVRKKARESFCDRVKREYARMTFAERLAAYQRATPQQIAAGRRCLGM